LRESLGKVYTSGAGRSTLDAERRQEGEGVQRVTRHARFDYASLTKLFNTISALESA